MGSPKFAALLTVVVLLLAGCDALRPLSSDLNGARDRSQETAKKPDTAKVPDTAKEADEPAAGSRTDDGQNDGTTGGDAAAQDTGDVGAQEPATTSGMGNMILPDVSAGLPNGHAGSGKNLTVSVPREHRGSDGTAAFRTVCRFSHMNFDDPIVFPGKAGASHLHAYFGNKSVDADSTASSIANTGKSTCSGGTLNRTGYWIPALVDSQTHKPIKPESALVYYKSGYHGVRSETIKAYPEGLRMIAGNAKSDGKASSNPNAEWICYPPNLTGPSDPPDSHIPTDCNSGDLLRVRVRFPQCWDGKNLDSSDHKSHMAYPPGTNGCPKSHPVPLPEITINVDFKVPSRAAANRWRLVSDAYSKDQPGGMSAHSDWFNGWDRATFERILDNCYRPAEDCNTDNLNDGTGLGWP